MKSTKRTATSGTKRRAKSIYAKGWATRRKNAAHRASPEGKMAQAIFGDNADASLLPGLAGLVGKETPAQQGDNPNASAKGWATRRARTAQDVSVLMKTVSPTEADRAAILAMAAEDAKIWAAEAASGVDTANDNKAEANGANPCFDAVARTLDLNRDEQLLSFMGDMAAGRQSGQQQGHYPFLVSRTQIEAIEQFLSDHGYSAWGKGSGSLMSVSIKPAA